MVSSAERRASAVAVSGRSAVAEKSASILSGPGGSALGGAGTSEGARPRRPARS
ncbi:hypothetical protein NKH18_10135 [Streptomyces sp. M10(2022)]